jgi:hypothetical protein
VLKFGQQLNNNPMENVSSLSVIIPCSNNNRSFDGISHNNVSKSENKSNTTRVVSYKH